MPDQTRLNRFFSSFIKLNETGKTYIEKIITQVTINPSSDVIFPLSHQEIPPIVKIQNSKPPEEPAMSRTARTISKYLDGVKIISLSFMDFNEHEENGLFKTQQLDCMDNTVSYSFTETAICFHCGNKTLEMPLDGEIFIHNKPYEEDIFSPQIQSGLAKPASGLETLLIVSKSYRKGIGLTCYNRSESSIDKEVKEKILNIRNLFKEESK
jgi:hypothetical protein